MRILILNIKRKIVQSLIGNFYTEKEVYEILHGMQYEMAQKIIGNRTNQEVIIPTDYFKECGKYENTNPFDFKGKRYEQKQK